MNFGRKMQSGTWAECGCHVYTLQLAFYWALRSKGHTESLTWGDMHLSIQYVKKLWVIFTNRGIPHRGAVNWNWELAIGIESKK